MAQKTTDKLKLGVFVIAGGIVLVLLLYMIGRKENLFGNTFLLRARFEHVQGLMPGNNVRFAGIQVGTVKTVDIINDTVIEVTMRIDASIKKHLRKDAIASIGTEGFIGNKVVNITPSKKGGSPISNNDILSSARSVNTDEIMRVLDQTTSDVSVAASNLKVVIQKLNSSIGLWTLLNDETLPKNISMSAQNIRSATIQAHQTTMNLNEIVRGIKEGKGSLGAIITDTTLSLRLNETLLSLENIGNTADSLALSISNSTKTIEEAMKNGKGTIHMLLSDSVLSQKVFNSLQNIEAGTASFNQNMEALKHNILFRGYFRKLEKQQAGKQN